MIEFLKKLVHGRRLLILGFGMEGKSSYKLLKQVGSYSCLDIADAKEQGALPGSKIYYGDGYLGCIPDYDIVFKSPGVVLSKDGSPLDCSSYDCRITSQTELFIEFYGKQIIGITGTKGKSTVASLLYHVLSQNGLSCLLAGNIGKPVFEIIGDISPETVIVLELSSHQLEFCRHSPSTAVFLNIFEDHLDHYGCFEKYFDAKKNIYRHQGEADTLYCAESTNPLGNEAVSRVVAVHRDVLPFDSPSDISGFRLRGQHNLDNCAFVYSVAKSFGITDGQFIAALETYIPLRHRLEFLGCRDGVDYYDDSISTTAESAISAIESIENASTVLLGGMDRGISYDRLVDFLASGSLSNVICMYDSGKRIFDMLKQHSGVVPAVTYCADLKEAAILAKEVTLSGSACILSPASASYGDFKNFEERGDFFRELVLG